MIPMAGIEEDKLEYDAEVAYITATSPVATDFGNKGSKSSFSEFEFSGEGTFKRSSSGVDKEKEVTKITFDSTDASEQSDTASAKKKKSSKPPRLPDPITIASPTHSLNTTSSSPLSSLLTPPHYTLDTGLPSTPQSKLKRIQEAQISPPSPKPAAPKFLKSSQYSYKTLVVYGMAGCGKTNFVEKLTHTNPAVFAKVISSTTRKKRTSEVSGVDFHYVSPIEMSFGITRGNYLEHIQLQKRSDKKPRRVTVLSHTAPKPRQTERRSSTPQLPQEPVLLELSQRTESKFDLTEADSPAIGGEMFGTTKQALTEATQQGKPCVVLNVSMTGAQQLRKGGMKASFVLIHSGRKPPKNDDVGPDFTISSDNPNHAYKEFQQYAYQQIQDLNLAQNTRYEVSKHEWDSLPTVELEASKDTGPHVQVRQVSFSEILTHYQIADLSKEKRLAKAELPKEGLLRRAKLNKKLHGERLLVFAMASNLLTDKDRLHLRMLQTIYSKLTGSSLNCRRFGTHWKAIGFHGVDPADDLQGVGILGLAQLIYFLDSQLTISLVREIYRYTRQEPHMVPFCVLSFHMTQVALTALREGHLTKLANKRDQVVVVVNEFYIATFYRYYQTWKSQNKSILELGPLIQKVGEYAIKHVREVLKEFEDYLSKREDLTQAPSALMETTYKPFTQLDDYSDV